jgi:putative phage-type endonuclease
MNAITKVHLQQGTPEWHLHRSQFNNASEAAAVLGISPWFPKTPRQLAEVKLGLKTVHMNAAMSRGVQFEDAARKNACDTLGIDFEPGVFVRGDFSASLDGISPDGKTLLEIKIPAKGQQSDLWKHVQSGEGVPAYYMAQLAHQMHCCDAEKAVFWVYDPGADLGMPYHLTRDELALTWGLLEIAWKAFRESVDNLELPDPQGDDEVPVEDQALLSVGEELIDVRAQLAALQEREKALEAREKALEDALKESLPKTHVSLLETPHGALRAQWVTRVGAVDYSKIPVLQGMDLEPFRKKSTTFFKLT